MKSNVSNSIDLAEQFSETRRFDENSGKTILMRVKEGSMIIVTSRTDLPALEISDDWIKEVRDSMPEMPANRRDRYVNDLGVTDYDAMV